MCVCVCVCLLHIHFFSHVLLTFSAHVSHKDLSNLYVGSGKRFLFSHSFSLVNVFLIQKVVISVNFVKIHWSSAGKSNNKSVSVLTFLYDS